MQVDGAWRPHVKEEQDLWRCCEDGQQTPSNKAVKQQRIDRYQVVKAVTRVLGKDKREKDRRSN